jgi:hypothetical protein
MEMHVRYVIERIAAFRSLERYEEKVYQIDDTV